jgi:nitric oxide reductase NorD protein
MPTQNIPAELDQSGEILRLYAKALSGREIHLVPRGASDARGTGWMTPVDDGKALLIKLPAKIDRFPTEKENFDWYKVILTHQAGHFEFGTFDFSFDRPSNCFTDWRPGLRQNRAMESGASDWRRFVQLFPDQQLGSLIFDLVEDGRVDARMIAAYPGIRPLYRRVTGVVLAARPRLNMLPLREAFLEALVQASLGAEPLQDLPAALKSEVDSGASVLAKVKQRAATVEDAAEATLRIYEIVARLPNSPIHDSDPDQRDARGSRRRDEAPNELAEPFADEDDLPFTSPQEVEFRLDNDHEKLRQFEINHSTQSKADESFRLAAESDGPLICDEPFSYLYSEWDFRAGSYRSRWCRVRERVMDEGTSDFYTETLAEHRPLVAQVTGRFEHFLPELFRKVTRRYDGEDLHLDGVIERVIDRRAGAAPAEKIYWRRERTQRDVAVALLLDMSATTNEYVQLDAAKAHRPAGPSAQAYSEYLKTIAAGVDGRGKPLRRRTIEVEKQAAIILCQALEKIGDSYALYGFSGSGRADVEFSVIKDFDERLSQRIARRIDRIEPAHATRMGAAIRHAIRKLEQVEAGSRILFLLSDGRPYDRDYGRDAEDKEYAVQDTRQALLEAKRRGIRPFCLTIDRDNADYMRTMCDEIPYEIVTKVEDLPIRLVAAYPSLTARRI